MADPPDSPVPTTDAARIDSLDALRGVAVLGILLLNIVGFGLPGAYVDPTVFGGDTGADLAAWLTTSMLFEGTMRGLFALLFGAGIVLFTSRLEQAGVPHAADLHVRRMLWLVAFGFVDSHLLLWQGDILYEYGLAGLVVYAFRKARPRTLIALAASIFILIAVRGTLEVRHLEALRADARTAAQLQESGATLTPQQQAALEDWKRKLEQLKPSPEKLRNDIEAMRGGFGSAYEQVTTQLLYFRTKFFYRYGFPESFATMLLGIALFSLGALQGRWSARRYALLALGGYALGLGINAAEAYATLRSGFDPVTLQWVSLATYELGRVPLTLGHIGLVMLLWQSGVLRGAMRRLAAVGRMAFTNYLAQSLIGMLVFTGVGLGLYGRLNRHELYYVVAAIWAAQLLWSPWWLARYRYGPAEWLWRSLTYGRRQRIRRDAGAAAPASA